VLAEFIPFGAEEDSSELKLPDRVGSAPLPELVVLVLLLYDGEGGANVEIVERKLPELVLGAPDAEF
jgi:hypothetical protein